MSLDKQPADSMHAARLQSTQSICRYYKYSGTCRYKQKQCRHQHIYQALPEGSSNLPLIEERHWCLSSSSVSSDEQDYKARRLLQDECLVEAEPWRFSLLSYNILADKYAKHYRSYLYDNVPSTYLDWHHRRTAIIAELAHLQPDIICLQEVDRFEDLESELEQLGYAGIYLQRDGGRRDGCATFWRTSLLKPALVRQLRYSQYDLKDNVALLVLFEPHSPEEAVQAVQAAGTAAWHGAVQQQQVQSEMSENYQLQQQELQEQHGQQQHKQDLLSQWLPRSWRSNSNSSHRQQRTHLKPAPGFHGSSGGSALYQLPSEVLGHRSRSWAGVVANGVTNNVSNNNVVGSSPDASSSLFGSAAHPRSKGGISSGRFGRIRSGKSSKAAAAAAAAEIANNRVDGGACSATEQLQVAPEWHRCALLVANTHIIFTPDKGEVKLGQARMLIQEAAQMAEWYLQQQQRAAAAACADTGNSSSKQQCSSSLQAAVPRGVATIIAGDFNATPNSPMYTFLSKGRIDLHKVNKRNVSHMCSGSSAKGYRGFRRTQKRRSIDDQRRSLEEQRRSLEQQQQQQQRDAAGTSATGQPSSSNSWQLDHATAIAANGVPSDAVGSTNAVSAGVLVAAADSSGILSSGSYSVGANSPSSSSSSSRVYAAPLSPTKSASSTIGAASSTAAGSIGSTPISSTTTDGSKQYRWSDKEVRRAAGMSFDELVEASVDAAVAEVAAASGSKFDFGSSRVSSALGSKPHSPTTKIARAAVAFGAHVAAGAGAAAASLAAAAAAESHEPLESVTGSAAAAAVASAVSSGEQPLLLRHDLQLKSCYESVLGREPDYTSSHSLFMDTCDYVWYTETPLTAPGQTQQQQQQMRGSSSDSNAQPCARDALDNSSGSSGHSEKLGRTADTQQQDSRRARCGLGYELKPVAVLLPPDGMRLTKGLPSRWLGSDHIALVADFELSLKELDQEL